MLASLLSPAVLVWKRSASLCYRRLVRGGDGREKRRGSIPDRSERERERRTEPERGEQREEHSSERRVGRGKRERERARERERER